MPAARATTATTERDYTLEHKRAGDAVVRLARLLAEMPWPEAATKDDVRRVAVLRWELERVADEAEGLFP